MLAMACGKKDNYWTRPDEAMELLIAMVGLHRGECERLHRLSLKPVKPALIESVEEMKDEINSYSFRDAIND